MGLSMKARILHFPTQRNKIMKTIHVPTVKLMLKHHRLIADARKRGYSPVAIAALVRSAEASKR